MERPKGRGLAGGVKGSSAASFHRYSQCRNSLLQAPARRSCDGLDILLSPIFGGEAKRGSAAVPQITVDLDDDLYRLLSELVASKPGRTPEDTLLELLIDPLVSYHFLQDKPQNFMATLTDEQAEALRQLAAHWRETLDQAFRRVVKDGIDMAMMEKANDEHHASSMPRQYGPSGDLDDDIPF
jgi:hypothetical protein